MKKTRFIVRVVTFVLSTLLVIGVLLLIFNEHSTQDTIYEIIVFGAGIGGMIMAVLEQISATKQESQISQMANEIRELMKEEASDLSGSRRIQDKLDKILELEKRHKR